MENFNASQTPVALIHATVFDGETLLDDQAVIIRGDTIVSVVPMSQAPLLPSDCIDVKGLLLTAGFIDLQLNGCGGVLFNSDISLDTLHIMNQTNLKSGTTQFLPTLITSPQPQMQQAINLVDSMENRERSGVLGLHLEGPFINVAKKGAHHADSIRQLTQEEAEQLAKRHSAVKVITLAPECVGQTAIDVLTDAGIKVSIGHTNATYQQLVDKQGLSMATHLYNAMTPLASREVGAVGYIAEHKPSTGIIVDGIHAAYPAVRIAKALLGEQLFLVTDAVTPAGTDLSSYEMAGQQAFVTDGKCHYKDGTIAGAAITMIDGIKNLIEHVGVTKEEALRMASLYPARALGIEDNFGKLKAGYKANIVMLDTALDIKGVYQMGIKRN
ncbi:N-acetylglucosamine-6-phosphate deacetylase [Photobacterium rosenbergii]|uniref:N-acetylglucosamine-6-phosphate deacetylase n=1 Tax=Photobacterium rosenbergii TaxID=294936 RepID=UPI001C9A1CA0|nr:N-acetylglucosamine-6-phosphate deacetylase [Photobacterium rosenbergii]MBY5943697.1 N-acetylglucosamine-6-phosphate deacetylase [Photobacterium rosenbergii]